MPFDARPPKTTTRPANRPVAIWLFIVCAMLLVMVVLGGVTRLTGSGLSIMEWAPLSGMVPPLSTAEWQRLYALYQQIPQYALLHQGMDLAGFQGIFWLEWTHRFWGRLIGLAVGAPLLWFWISGRIDRSLVPRLVGIFLLGGMQGGVGWFMVASGFFPDSTAVSAYRLVVHLALALILYGAILWTGLSCLTPAAAPASRGHGTRRLAQALAVLVSLTILAGGFVAGNHAGLTYNSFPLMDGRLVPDGYAMLTPWVRNLFENIPAVQFDHRLLATLTVLAILAALLAAPRSLPRAARLALIALGLVVLAQYLLGVATLMLVVPVWLAALHQGTAVLVLTASLCLLHALRGANPRPR